MKISHMVAALALFAIGAMVALPSAAHSIDPPVFASSVAHSMPTLDVAPTMLDCSVIAADLCRSPAEVASIDPKTIAPTYIDDLLMPSRMHGAGFAPRTLIPK